MYQTKPLMSTGAEAIAKLLTDKIGPFAPDQAVFGRVVPTCVTCPILRPGRGAPLP